jgi:hypothetical protein
VYNAILPFFILPILQLGHFLPVINNNCHPCLGLRMRQFKFMASWLLRVMLDFSTWLLICWPREYIIQHQFGEDHPSAYELAGKDIPTYHLQRWTQPTEGFAEILCFPQFQPCALMSISCMRILRENINVGFLPLINSVFYLCGSVSVFLALTEGQAGNR